MPNPLVVSVSDAPAVPPSELKAQIARIRQEFDRPLDRASPEGSAAL